MMGNKWSDSHHLRLKLLQELQIFRQMLHSLPRRSYHKSGPHLVSKTFQIIQALLPHCQTHGGGMELSVQFLIGRLMAQQITVRPGLLKNPVTLIRTLPQGKRHCTVRIFFLYRRDNIRHSPVSKPAVLSPLQHKSPVSQFISF